MYAESIDRSEDYSCKAAKNIDEATALIEAGFDFVCDLDFVSFSGDESRIQFLFFLPHTMAASSVAVANSGNTKSEVNSATTITWTNRSILYPHTQIDRYRRIRTPGINSLRALDSGFARRDEAAYGIVLFIQPTMENPSKTSVGASVKNGVLLESAPMSMSCSSPL